MRHRTAPELVIDLPASVGEGSAANPTLSAAGAPCGRRTLTAGESAFCRQLARRLVEVAGQRADARDGLTAAPVGDADETLSISGQVTDAARAA
jgi:hypothetical protein